MYTVSAIDLSFFFFFFDLKAYYFLAVMDIDCFIFFQISNIFQKQFLSKAKGISTVNS